MDSESSEDERAKRPTKRGDKRSSTCSSEETTKRGSKRPFTSQQSTSDRPSLSTSQQSTSDRPSPSTSQQSTSAVTRSEYYLKTLYIASNQKFIK